MRLIAFLFAFALAGIALGPGALAGSTYTAPGGGAADATELTYTPAVLADWTGGIDPGESSDAFDQLASRVDTLEESPAVSCGAYDWADPCYEQAGDDLSSVLLADWPDAAGVGATSDVCRDQIANEVVRIRADLESDCTTSYGATNRAVGVLRTIGAGDFWVAFRLQIIPTNWDDAAAVTTAGPVFVDGASAADNSWYGFSVMYSSEKVREGVGLIYRLANEAGANRFDTYGTYASTTVAGFGVQVDAVMQRTGTTLNGWMGPAGGPLYSLGSFTVTAGAGLIGLRSQTLLGTNLELDVTLMAYRAGLTELPY